MYFVFLIILAKVNTRANASNETTAHSNENPVV
jgi:hypothetical protein